MANWNVNPDTPSEVIPIFAYSITINHSDILLLPTVAKEIIPTPPSGKVYLFVGGSATLNWFADYTNVDNSGYVLLSMGQANPIASRLPIWIFNNGGTTTGFLSPLTDIIEGIEYGQQQLTDSFVSDTGFVIGCANGGSGNFTGGDSRNTLKVTIAYSIIDI